jgi:DNA-nicking Smr family endonuclease
MKRGGGGPLREADRQLWESVVASVTPIGARRKGQSPAGHIAHEPDPAVPAVANVADLKIIAAGPTQQRRHHPPPLPVLDRRTRQKLLRGQVEIEARLDLHGETAVSAPHVLSTFLRRARDRGHRTVLVVTGKGSSNYVRHTLHAADHWHAPERQGLLRRSFPGWIESPALRDVVSGYQPAHPKHGGGGAWYVRLRQPRPRE